MEPAKTVEPLEAATEALESVSVDANDGVKVSKRQAKKDAKKAQKEQMHKAPKPAKASKPAKDAQKPAATDIYSVGFLANLHKPGENTQKNPERMQEHLAATRGRVFTRFPPEPNGYLHIGHSKALLINFGYARHHGGECYLRFDDTNPEAEDESYTKSIIDMVDWLGFKPYKVTYSSDYFDQLYNLAEELIKRGLAYVDHSTDAEINEQRGGEHHGPRCESRWRNRPIEENLAEFRAMRDGKYKPKEAVLRMKQDITNGNPQMWDLAAYRILEKPHHRTGDKWRIYPTYDFTHCLVDSFENISHSLCTVEFQLSRESYEWLCNALDVYCPAQREYGRLNVMGTVLSKRKILRLVMAGAVRGWDDPRLYTLVALRRRGVPPGAILQFVSDVGVTTADSVIQLGRFEAVMRKYLENSVPRLMMVPDPIRVVIDNLPEEYVEDVEVPFNPKIPEMGSRVVPFTRIVYIDRSDFREEDSSDYFRLAPGKAVGLFRVPRPIVATSFTKDPVTGLVTEIRALYQDEGPLQKPKAYIQWVAECPSRNSPIRISEVREVGNLFTVENPSLAKDILEVVNPDSEVVLRHALIESGLNEVKRTAPWPKVSHEEGKDDASAPESVRFQAMRVGYYCIDSDTTADSLVLNRIVTLREDTNKN